MRQKKLLEKAQNNRPPEPGKWTWVEDNGEADSKSDNWYLGVCIIGHNWWSWSVHKAINMVYPAACGYAYNKEEAMRLAEEAACHCWTLELAFRQYDLVQALKNESK